MVKDELLPLELIEHRQRLRGMHHVQLRHVSMHVTQDNQLESFFQSAIDRGCPCSTSPRLLGACALRR